MSDQLRSALVRVPCSTSNLGSGYDTIGLALKRYLEVGFTPDDRGTLVIEREGTLTALTDHGGPDLVATTFETVLAEAGLLPSGVLRLRSDIPIARGLGSSSAALLAGYDLGRAVCGMSRDEKGAFSLALKHEGHGDNAAPCLYGGLRGVTLTASGPVVVDLHLSDAVGFAYAAPAVGLETEAARGALPEHVPHKTATASLGRLVALVRGLAEGRPDLIHAGVNDDLHVPYRLPLIPGAAAAMSAGMDAGAWAVTVSGAGSGLIAMCEPGEAEKVASAMKDSFTSIADDSESVGFSVRPDLLGLQRLEG